MERGLNPFAAFRHGLVGQSDDLDSDLAGCHHHLDIDRNRIDTLKGDGLHPGNHGADS